VKPNRQKVEKYEEKNKNKIEEKKCGNKQIFKDVTG